MAEIVQKNVVILKRKEIANTYWSVPHWSLLAAAPVHQGMVRHGGVPQVVDYVKSKEVELKLTYPTHAQGYLDFLGDPDGRVPRALVAFGTRNTFQNLGLPGAHRARNPYLLRRPDEPWDTWTYQALCKFDDDRIEIRAVRFDRNCPEGDADHLRVLDAEDAGAKIEWAVTGQPLLWDGEVPPLDLLAACTYDLRHIWRLRWEDWQSCPVEFTIHTELMQAFMEKIRSPIEERAATLSAIAAQYGLPISRDYLHSSLGVTPAGDLILLMQHGSLTDIGTAQKALGAQRAILLDNGGSVGMAYWSKRNWQQEGWTGIKESPVYIGNGSYFRPRGHAVMVIELAEDVQERPFRERSSGLAPWSFPAIQKESV